MSNNPTDFSARAMGRFLVFAIQVLLCAVPIAAWLGSPDGFFTFDLAKTVYSRLLIAFAFALWIILVAYAPRYRPKLTWLLLIVLAYLALLTVSAFMGVDSSFSIWGGRLRMSGVVQTLHWAAYALMLATMLRDGWKTLLLVNLLVGVFVALIGMSQQYLLPDYIFPHDRIRSTIGNALILSTYACLNVGFALAWAYLVRSKAALALAAVAVSLNVWVVLVSQSRSSVLALVAMAVLLAGYLLVFSPSRVTRALAGAGLVALAVFVIAAIVTITTDFRTPLDDAGFVQRSKSAVAGNETSVSTRMELARVAVKAFMERPIWGYGPENYNVAWGSDEAGLAGRPSHILDSSHNYILESMATGGIAVTVPYLLMHLLMGYHIIRAVGPGGGASRNVDAAMGMTMAGYLVTAMFMVDAVVYDLHIAFLTGYALYRANDPASAALAVPGRLRAGWNTLVARCRSRGRTAVCAAGVLVAAASLYSTVLVLLIPAFPAVRDGSLPLPMTNLHRVFAIESALGASPYYYDGREEDDMGFTRESVRESVHLNASKIMDSQPVNWLYILPVIFSYQDLARGDPAYLDYSGKYLQRMDELAPMSRVTEHLNRRQSELRLVWGSR